MRLLSDEEISGIEFPDSEISDFELSKSKLTFTADGGYVEGQGVIDEKMFVAIESWESLSVLRYDGENETELSLGESGCLREICECSFSSNLVKLAGFEGSSGLWQSYEFKRPRVTVSVG